MESNPTKSTLDAIEYITAVLKDDLQVVTNGGKFPSKKVADLLLDFTRAIENHTGGGGGGGTVTTDTSLSGTGASSSPLKVADGWTKQTTKIEDVELSANWGSGDRIFVTPDKAMNGVHIVQGAFVPGISYGGLYVFVKNLPGMEPQRQERDIIINNHDGLGRFRIMLYYYDDSDPEDIKSAHIKTVIIEAGEEIIVYGSFKDGVFYDCDTNASDIQLGLAQVDGTSGSGMGVSDSVGEYNTFRVNIDVTGRSPNDTFTLDFQGHVDQAYRPYKGGLVFRKVGGNAPVKINIRDPEDFNHILDVTTLRGEPGSRSADAYVDYFCEVEGKYEAFIVRPMNRVIEPVPAIWSSPGTPDAEGILLAVNTSDGQPARLTDSVKMANWLKAAFQEFATKNGLDMP